MSYLWRILTHKWFVFLAGLKIGVPLWQLILHDWSKFTPFEFKEYRRQFFLPEKSPIGWARAWLHHQNLNKHHWEYWIPRDGTRDYPDNQPLIMPLIYVKEMVADWMGASRAYEGFWPDPDNWKWWNEHKDKIRLHPATIVFLDSIMENL